MYKDVWAIILAGGKGVRMGGELPKVLNLLGGKPLIFWTLNLLKQIGITNSIVVTGYKANLVRTAVVKNGYEAVFAKQRKPLGTADAVKTGLSKVPENAKLVLVLYGDDSALYRKSTIEKLIDIHLKAKSPVSILTLKAEYPTRVGGVEMDKDGKVVGVLSFEELLKSGIKENYILCGAFCFEKSWLTKNIGRIKRGKLKGEYPLPVLLQLAAEQGKFPNLFVINDDREWNSVNSEEELLEAERKKKEMGEEGG